MGAVLVAGGVLALICAGFFGVRDIKDDNSNVS
jgi:hypothetical protein